MARARATTKFLTRLGNRVTVWTRGVPSDHDELEVHRVPEPRWPPNQHWLISQGYPDNLCYWALKLCWLARNERYDVLYTSGPHHSVHWIGYLLKRRLGVPWVMEYRDTWGTNFLNFYRPGWIGRIDRVLERHFGQFADRIVAVTPTVAGSLCRQFGAKVRYIPNGYDPEEFQSLPVHSPNSPRQIVFAGALSPFRNLEPVAKALEVTEADFIVLGTVDQDLGPTTKRLADQGRIRFAGVCGRRETLNHLARADLLVHVGEAIDRYGESIAGKLYEYIASGRPILSLVNRGDASRMLRAVPHSRCAPPEDVEAITKALTELLQTDFHTAAVPSDIEIRHSYPNIARKLDSLFKELV